MKDSQEEIMPNGLDLASVRKELKSCALVKLKVWHSRDMELSQDYNFEYTVYNNLLNTQDTYSKSYEGRGGDILKEAEEKFSEEVKWNQVIIEKVKRYLEENTVNQAK